MTDQSTSTQNSDADSSAALAETVALLLTQLSTLKPSPANDGIDPARSYDLVHGCNQLDINRRKRSKVQSVLRKWRADGRTDGLTQHGISWVVRGDVLLSAISEAFRENSENAENAHGCA